FPVVAGYQWDVGGTKQVVYLYEFLAAERAGYSIRLPADSVLQNKIGYLLKRPVGPVAHNSTGPTTAERVESSQEKKRPSPYERTPAVLDLGSTAGNDSRRTDPGVDKLNHVLPSHWLEFQLA